MKCTDCRAKLTVTHTYPVKNARFQRAVCPECGMIHKVQSKVTPVRYRGDGAKAAARRYRILSDREENQSS